MSKLAKVRARLKRHKRVRKVILGTPERPRLCVYRSNRHIYGQIIDDLSGCTLVSASSLEAEIKSRLAESTNGGRLKVAQIVGRSVAERALSKGISRVVFDRGGFLYHGQVKALADEAREVGLEF